MIRLVPGSATAVGQVRAVNQDAVLVTGALFAVADGMGGHRGGEVASAVALEALAEAVNGQTTEELVEGVERANRAVFDRAGADSSLAGMGTTLVLLGLVTHEGRGRLGIVNVGDSRAYLLAGLEFAQLSEDHSLVETLVRSGQLTEDEAANHPRRNVLTRALGIEPDVDVDAWVIEPHAGDRFLLCSDGLFNELDDDEITAVLRQLIDPSQAATELVRLADEAGGRDNISVVVVDVVDAPEPPDALGALDAAEATIDDRLTRVTSETDESAFSAPPAQVPSPPTPPVPPRPVTVGPQPVAPLVNDHEHRWTWRVGLFAVSVVAVLALALGAVTWTARSGYFVIAESGNVILYRGHQGGLLWFEPTLVKDTGVSTSDLRESDQAKLEAGKSFPERSEADAYIADLSALASSGSPINSTTITTTSAGATTTTLAAGP
jgi:serine/threonine protein phosphatase PrpC